MPKVNIGGMPKMATPNVHGPQMQGPTISAAGVQGPRFSGPSMTPPASPVLRAPSVSVNPASLKGAGKVKAPQSSYTVLFVGLGVIFVLVIALILFFALRS